MHGLLHNSLRGERSISKLEILQCRQLTANVFSSILNILRANSGTKVILFTNFKIKSELYADKIEEYVDEQGFAGDVIMINGGLGPNRS